MIELLKSSMGLWAFVCGGFLCAVYDIFRMLRLRRPAGNIRLFVADFTFCLISAAVVSVLFFNLSYGRVRIYALLFALPGFLLWRCTVSRLFIGLVNCVLNFVGGTVKAVGKFVKTACSCLLKKIRTKFYCRALVKRARHGFGVNRKE